MPNLNRPKLLLSWYKSQHSAQDRWRAQKAAPQASPHKKGWGYTVLGMYFGAENLLAIHSSQAQASMWSSWLSFSWARRLQESWRHLASHRHVTSMRKYFKYCPTVTLIATGYYQVSGNKHIVSCSLAHWMALKQSDAGDILPFCKCRLDLG